MKVSISKTNKTSNKASKIYLFETVKDLKTIITAEEEKYISKLLKDDTNLIQISDLDTKRYFLRIPDTDDHFKYDEKLRISGFEIFGDIKSNKITDLELVSSIANDTDLLKIAEGIALTSYEFDKYKSKKSKGTLNINLVSSKIETKSINELNNLIESTHIARDFVNEPQSYLNTIQYSKDLAKYCKEYDIKYTKFDKKKIVELGMGGLLAVNQGSVTPPIFNILEYKPKGAVNKNPMIFVGKGVVYDTGGLSLKPTANSMDMMKCDMAGSAAVAGAIFAIAQNKLPIHVISLIAATDNRPGGDAYTPGDVITMYNGKTVEVLNTDAEGRLTLGDALTYADELKPELVIDLATLTGAAVRAIGKEASVMMGNAPAEVMIALQESGMKVYERLVEFPMYEEYEEDLKSDIADIKNLGGADAGATTAGIFLGNFTQSPWIHIDIAGTAFLTAPDKYRGKNGTGVGVRLLYQFVKDYYNVG